MEHYSFRFRKVVEAHSLEYDPELLEFLLKRYKKENRPLRCSEPRDLIHRSLDICRYLNQPPGLSRELLELAWINYFGAGKAGQNKTGYFGPARCRAKNILTPPAADKIFVLPSGKSEKIL